MNTIRVADYNVGSNTCTCDFTGGPPCLQPYFVHVKTHEGRLDPERERFTRHGIPAGPCAAAEVCEVHVSGERHGSIVVGAVQVDQSGVC